MRFAALCCLALALAGCATALHRDRVESAAEQVPLDRDPAVAALTTEQLTLFENDAALRRYLREVKRISSVRHAGRPAPNQFAQAASAGPIPCPIPEDCPEQMSDENIVVTGSAVSSNPSITNNQKAGVEEGDIVKQIGQFLLVLQDGRIFVVDTRPPAGGLTLADRKDVYRDPKQDTWYDEMLVFEDRVVVTGYSYDEYASEVSVFHLSPEGKLAHEGTFYVSSNDYYDSENYATRVADGRLVIYTPIDLDEVDEDKPIAWPVIRRWMPGVDREEARRRGTRLLDARSIYRPVQPTLEPVVHTVSVCPLGRLGPGVDLRCRTTGFVGPARREWYVSTTDAYLWVSPGWSDAERLRRSDERCAPGARPSAPGETLPAMLFRVPLSGREPGVVGTHGVPINQFSLETNDGEFRALVRWPQARCEPGWSDDDEADADPAPALRYFEAPLSRFSPLVEDAPGHAYTPVPSPLSGRIENRFTERYLVYGGRKSWSSYPPEDDEKLPGSSRVVAVPLDRPQRPALLEVPHNILRIERAGDNMVLTGYRDGRGLDVSLVGLDGSPRVASTARLIGRFESEGRSHAFNSLIDTKGSGLMGLPTVPADEKSGRYPWNSDASDVSFLSADSTGRLEVLGELRSRENLPDEDEAEWIDDYACAVSCIDWYGNSRPIFTDGRVFALTGTELVEGRVVQGRIVEIRRLSLTGARRR